MISDSASSERQPAGQEALATLVATDGSALHPHVAALLVARVAQRDLADAVHAICAVHGGAGERVFEAIGHSVDTAQGAWLGAVADGFAGERSYLAAIVSAAGPLPSTPGQAQTEQAFATQRHAFHMLAISDRQGCMLGATAALVLDWRSIRRLLDHAATRFGASYLSPTLPDEAGIAAVVTDSAASPAARRAMAFGAQQVLAQHRALWDLLDARASARAAG